MRQACGLSFDGYTHPERLVSTNVRYDFEARGYARANFIVDPVHWAVIVKVDRHGLWRVTYGEDARLPEEGVEERIPGALPRAAARRRTLRAGSLCPVPGA